MRGKVARILRRMAKERGVSVKHIKKLYKAAAREGKVK